MRRNTILALLAAFLAGGAACGPQQRDNAVLRPLTRQQAHGKSLYDLHCASCHHAYESADLHGPSMQGLFQKPYMPSGTPANDERVADVILMGRAKMPAYRGRISEQDLKDLLAYLHRL